MKALYTLGSSWGHWCSGHLEEEEQRREPYRERGSSQRAIQTTNRSLDVQKHTTDKGVNIKHIHKMCAYTSAAHNNNFVYVFTVFAHNYVVL